MRRAMAGAAIWCVLGLGASLGQWPGPPPEPAEHDGEYPGGLHVCADGPRRNIVEARLGDNLHRETFPDWPDLPRCGRICPAPPSTAGAFAIQYEKSRERFLVAAWAETDNPGRPRRLISVSPLSDRDTLAPFANNPRPIVLRWLSPVALRVSQIDPSLSGEDKLRVVVIRFEPKYPGIWYCTWRGPAPLENTIKVTPRTAAPKILPDPKSK